MKKREYQLRRINGSLGSIQWVVGLFFLLFLIALLSTEMQLGAYRVSGLYLEDALAASNLASAVIDIEEYGISHTIQIADPKEAYRKYRMAVKDNLQLDENWVGRNASLISGPVTVVKYIVYNVKEDEVKIYHIDSEGRLREDIGMLGAVAAPNGMSIETTGIYSEIAFPIKGVWGITVTAHKGKLVDIVGEKGEENAEEEGST